MQEHIDNTELSLNRMNNLLDQLEAIVEKAERQAVQVRETADRLEELTK